MKILLLCVYSLLICIGIHPYDYDLIILGGGAAGLTAAKFAAERGKAVLIIEQHKIGGGRIWTGEIPFTMLYNIANIYQLAQEGYSLGIESPTNFMVNSRKVLEVIHAIQTKMYDLTTRDTLLHHNITVAHGRPYFVDNHTIFLDHPISGDKFIIATGARPYIPYFEGVDTLPLLDCNTFFNQVSLPKSIIILGGGPLGIELASTLNRIGIKTTLLMKHGLILPTYDLEIIELVTKQLLQEGIIIHSDIKPVKGEYDPITNLCTLHVEDRGRNIHSYQAERIFIASGQTPNIEDLQLENTNVAATMLGIKVNNFLETTAPNIWACGNVTGIRTINRIAYQQAKIAIHNIFRSFFASKKAIDEIHAPHIIHLYPPLASYGLSEEEALKTEGSSIKIYKCHYKSLERSFLESMHDGFAKFICTEQNLLIGAHIFGIHAHELIEFFKLGQPITKVLSTLEEQAAITIPYSSFNSTLTETSDSLDIKDRPHELYFETMLFH